jgi:hypothetical protein
VGAGYRIDDVLDLPVTAVELLAEAAGKRRRADLIQTINAHRIAGADAKSYKEAIRSIERG